MVQPALMLRHIGKGRRDYIFPPLPHGLTEKQRIGLCRRWVTAELVSRGMVCEMNLYRTENGTEPHFSCPIFAVGPDGFGDEIEEWGTSQFFDHLKRSFAKTVNDTLEKQGLPRSYEVL
jgi:hypothetical protein